MKINKDQTLKDIQSQFTSAYPMLTLKFYSKEHGDLEGSSIKDELDINTTVSSLNPNIRSGTIELSDEMTVTELERVLEHDYGLHGQVFRKSGSQWLQTSRTDHWTLGHQEENAEKYDSFSHKKLN